MNRSALHRAGAKLGQTKASTSQDEVSGTLLQSQPQRHGQAGVFRPFISASPEGCTFRDIVDPGPWGQSPWTLVAIHHWKLSGLDAGQSITHVLTSRASQQPRAVRYHCRDTRDLSGLETLAHSPWAREKQKGSAWSRGG